ncbi:hypothetical protein [Telluribacter sp. SYSU D00476]|uniref:hypothetical protein n=1 Tax=Telluribacter sp. SYSU D00476 TaxID=2811430 RepID=UPI001FF1F3C7|nr:hypothetical protein [Telluribacter sp. SYSU D00476]
MLPHYSSLRLLISHIKQLSLKMKRQLVSVAMQLFVVVILVTACKNDDLLQPKPPVSVPQPEEGFFPVHVKAVITVGDVVYDSIPATFTITTWDARGVTHQKDTTLPAGKQVIYLSKNASRYGLKLQKWGITDEKILNKTDVIEGALYQLGGRKEAKKLQWVSEYRFVNEAPQISTKQHFIYDDQGRINEVHAYAPDPNDGVLRSGSSDIFLYDGNELWVNNTSKKNGTVWSHNAYTFDDQGRIIQSKYRYLLDNYMYTNQYTSEGIVMFMGKNATDPNGSRIVLRYVGGNRVEEKTIIPGYTTTLKNFKYDFNINPYVVIKMPSLYFEHSSKNNVIAEGWEGGDQFTYEYQYDADGYVTEVTTKIRNNNGQIMNYSKTVYTY